MHNPYTFSYIIAYRHDRSRVLNLKRTVELASSYSNVDLIVVEQGDEPKLPPYSLRGFRHFFLESTLPFNRGWALNVGLKNSMGQAIVFSSPDHLYEPNSLIRLLASLNENEVTTFSDSLKLNVNEVYLPFDSWKKIDRKDGSPGCSGPVAYRKEAIQRVGGWSEDLLGDGKECDRLQEGKLRFMKHSVLDAVTYELPHLVPVLQEHHKTRNSVVEEKIKSFSDKDLERYWSNSSTRMGKSNRFVDV